MRVEVRTVDSTKEQDQIVQTARIPLSQVTSFPFRFQFKQLRQTVPPDQDLLVQVQVVVEPGDEQQQQRSTVLWQGRGVAKALLLPGDLYVRSAAAIQLQETTSKASNNSKACPQA